MPSRVHGYTGGDLPKTKVFHYLHMFHTPRLYSSQMTDSSALAFSLSFCLDVWIDVLWACREVAVDLSLGRSNVRATD